MNHPSPTFDFRQWDFRPASTTTNNNNMTTGRKKKIPPASEKAIANLPALYVTGQDLDDPRCLYRDEGCCICLQDNFEVGDRIVRLPCAHFFCADCATDWLRRTCTCPVCHYELETDDPRYEVGRAKRMAKRKPRYSHHELSSLPVRTLLELLADDEDEDDPQARTVLTGLEKEDLVRLVIDQKRVDLVAPAEDAPPPPSQPYHEAEMRHQEKVRKEHLSELSVRELKTIATRWEIEYNPRDILEKSDLVSLLEQMTLAPVH